MGQENIENNTEAEASKSLDESIDSILSSLGIVEEVVLSEEEESLIDDFFG